MSLELGKDGDVESVDRLLILAVYGGLVWGVTEADVLRLWG
jgi:hypothetical protein